ncbi:MAG: hypothetical protein K6E27_12375 [Eubacterium sp.]|nr:hypothetical protein [Eubacterium sp.]
MKTNKPSQDYIEYICSLYGAPYDDREEDTKPPAAGNGNRIKGVDWVPGKKASHKSLVAFQKQLREQDINLSTSKIRKILITGGCWSTERSRQINDLYIKYTTYCEEMEGLTSDEAIKKIADELGVSIVTVDVNLPYLNVVYNLENKSSNAARCEKYRQKLEKSIQLGITEQLKDVQNNYNLNIPAIKSAVSEFIDSDTIRKINDFAILFNNTVPELLKEINDLRDYFVTYSQVIKESIESISVVLSGIKEAAPEISAIYKLSQNQFVIWDDIPQDVIDYLYSNGDAEDVQKYLEGIIETAAFISSDAPLELLANRGLCENKTYEQSVRAFERGDFNVAALGFTALLDRYLSEKIDDKTLVSITKRAKELGEKMESIDDIFKEERDYKDYLLLCTYSYSLEKFGARSNFDEAEPETLNRHWIMHGRTNKEYSKMDCIRIIRMLSGTVLVNEMI